LNRVDDIIIFGKLDRSALCDITRLELKKLAGRLNSKGIEFTFDDKAVEFVTDKGSEPEYGARPIRRAVERMVEDALALELLSGKFTGTKRIAMSVSDDKIVFKKGRGGKK
ncbi:MAG: ATP-dependent Clp protease ATP-binding subunit, partial [Lentisphaeria bacterium]|nr:ATP-dependent Clp protease ATP-binding subunit [Lentisphaeria bacterium]